MISPASLRLSAEGLRLLADGNDADWDRRRAILLEVASELDTVASSGWGNSVGVLPLHRFAGDRFAGVGMAEGIEEEQRRFNALMGQALANPWLSKNPPQTRWTRFRWWLADRLERLSEWISGS